MISPLPQILSQKLNPAQDTNEFKQHLNTTGHPNFPYHTSLDINFLYTYSNMKKSLTTTTLHFEDKPRLIPQHICFHHPIPYILLSRQLRLRIQRKLLPTAIVEMRVEDVENTAIITYTDLPNIYRHFVDDGIGYFRDKSHADGFLNFLNWGGGEVLG